MKKIIVAIVLVFAGLASAQSQPQAQPAAPQSQPTAQGQPAAPQTQPAAQPQAAQPPAQQKKEIKDPSEYNAYVGAVQQQDPAAKISGLEAFLTQYPNSVMKEDALELLMGAYQQTNNGAKMMDTVQKLLQVDPNNLRGLALCAYSKRAAAEAGQNAQQNLTDAAQCGQRGLTALQTAARPDGMAEPDFDKMKTQMAAIFNGAAGINALQTKDYPNAQKYLRAAVQSEPTELRNVYPLALAYLTANPPDNVNGLFFIARAANLAAGSSGQAQIQAYGKSQYTKYHGSDQGWDELLATTKTTTTPPDGFTISKYVPPTPAEQCTELISKNDPKKMAFAEWELCLSEGKPEDAEKVWNAIKGVSLVMEAPVMQSSATTLQIAASQDDIDQKRADIELEMLAPIPAKLIPKEGATIDFEGTPVSYEPKPFVMKMNKGALITKAPPPAKKPPVRKKPAAH